MNNFNTPNNQNPNFTPAHIVRQTQFPVWLIITLAVFVWGCILTILDDPLWFVILMAFAAPAYIIALIVAAVKNKPVTGLAVCLSISFFMWIILLFFNNDLPTDDERSISSAEQICADCVNSIHMMKYPVILTNIRMNMLYSPERYCRL
jgi:hypothetical protein